MDSVKKYLLENGASLPSKLDLGGAEIIARFEPELNRGGEPVIIKNWWWEEGYIITDEVLKEVRDCFKRFCRYLQV